MLEFLTPYATPIVDSTGSNSNNKNSQSTNQQSGSEFHDLSSFFQQETDQLEYSSIDPSYAYIFGVFPETIAVNGQEDYESWKNNSLLCEGNVKAVLIKCPVQNTTTGTTTGSETDKKKTFGEFLCTHNNNDATTNNQLFNPFLYIIKYNTISPSTTDTTPSIESKHVYTLKNFQDAREIVFESLPQTTIKPIMTNEGFQQFMKENHEEGIMSILFLSKKAKISHLLTNIALSASLIKTVENPDKGKYFQIQYIHRYNM